MCNASNLIEKANCTDLLSAALGNWAVFAAIVGAVVISAILASR